MCMNALTLSFILSNVIQVHVRTVPVALQVLKTVLVTVAVSVADWRPWMQEEGGGPGALGVVAGGGGRWTQELPDLQKKPPIQPWLKNGDLQLTLGKERIDKIKENIKKITTK